MRSSPPGDWHLQSRLLPARKFVAADWCSSCPRFDSLDGMDVILVRAGESAVDSGLALHDISQTQTWVQWRIARRRCETVTSRRLADRH